MRGCGVKLTSAHSERCIITAAWPQAGLVRPSPLSARCTRSSHNDERHDGKSNATRPTVAQAHSSPRTLAPRLQPRNKSTAPSGPRGHHAAPRRKGRPVAAAQRLRELEWLGVERRREIALLFLGIGLRLRPPKDPHGERGTTATTPQYQHQYTTTFISERRERCGKSTVAKFAGVVRVRFGGCRRARVSSRKLAHGDGSCEEPAAHRAARVLPAPNH